MSRNKTGNFEEFLCSKHIGAANGDDTTCPHGTVSLDSWRGHVSAVEEVRVHVTCRMDVRLTRQLCALGSRQRLEHCERSTKNEQVLCTQAT